MQLTRYTDYSLRVLLYLAACERGQRVTVADIAERFEIARNHLIKVVNRLGQLGYVKTIRGKGGGITLGREASDIGIGAVVRDMENNLTLIDCNAPPCPLRSNCQLKGILNRAGRAFLAVLDEYTLADLAREPEPLRMMLNISR